MANEQQSVCDLLEIDLTKLTSEIKVNLIDEIFDTLTVQDLSRVRDIVEDKREEKLEAAKVRVIAEAREKFEQLGLTFEDVIASQHKRKQAARTPAMPENIEVLMERYGPVVERLRNGFASMKSQAGSGMIT